MVYREPKEELVRQGLIKPCPLDRNEINNLMKRARIDLKTAQRNINEDAECSYNYAYNAVLRAGLTLMFSGGYRPDVMDKHPTVVKFVSIGLGQEHNTLVNSYDYMRRKRHHLICEPGLPCLKKEAKDAIDTAARLVDIIDRLIMEKNP
jgi:uncharacterized protein (UPF0332 family)